MINKKINNQNDFGNIQTLKRLENEIYKIKITNMNSFIDKAEEFISIYESIEKESQKLFNDSYNEISKKLEEIQTNILNQKIYNEKIRRKIKTAIEEGPINNKKY